jgi:predicted metallopeptidase
MQRSGLDDAVVSGAPAVKPAHRLSGRPLAQGSGIRIHHGVVTKPSARRVILLFQKLLRCGNMINIKTNNGMT